MWERFLPKTKAMLSAIRTPTEEMRQGGASAHGQKAQLW